MLLVFVTEKKSYCIKKRVGTIENIYKKKNRKKTVKKKR